MATTINGTVEVNGVNGHKTEEVAQIPNGINGHNTDDVAQTPKGTSGHKVEDIAQTLDGINTDAFANDGERIQALTAAYALISRLETPWDFVLRLVMGQVNIRF